MEILEAYDLVGTYRGAVRLVGCDHHTVKHYVERRAAAADPSASGPRPSMIDAYFNECLTNVLKGTVA